MGNNSTPVIDDKKNEKIKEVGSSSNHTECNEDKPHNRNKNGGSEVRQSSFPPWFAKQRKNPVKAANTKDASPSSSPSASFYSWKKPKSCSLSAHSPVVTSDTPSASTVNTIIASSCSSDIPTDDQAVSSRSLSSSFHRSNHHDSGIGVSEQPASSASSETSLPSNHCKIITPMSSGKNANSNEVSNLPHNRNKNGGSEVRQSSFPPWFAKQRKNPVKAANTKDASPSSSPSASFYSWQKPKSCSLSSHSPVVTSDTPSASTVNTIIASSCSSDIPTDDQAVSSRSLSSSFHRSNHHDSGIGVSEQPASSASSETSLPSNHCKIITPMSSGKNANSNEVSNLDIETNSSGTSDSGVRETNSSDTSDSDDDEIIYIGEFQRESPPQQLTVSEKEVEMVKTKCSQSIKVKDPIALKIKKEKLDDCVTPHNGNKSGVSRSGQSGLPPQFAKQRGNLDKTDSVNNVIPCDISVDLVPETSSTKDASPSPVSAIIHTSRSHYPVVTSNAPSINIGNTIVSSCSSVIPAEEPVVVKSSSFYHNDQQDSGVGVIDQPASSERSPPSNDYKIITPMISENSNEVSDLPHNRKKIGGSRFTQKRFPPQIAKQRENLVKTVSVNVLPWGISVDSTSKLSNIKDTSPSPPSSVNVWEKPIKQSLCSHSPVVTSNAPSTSIGYSIVSSCSSVIPADEQVVASTSKSSSFYHSDQHDSGIGVNDQPASAPSSQRSSPSYYCKIFAPKISGKNANSNEVSDLPFNRNKSGGSSFKQSRLPPGVTKQRENLVKAVSVNNVFPCDTSSDLTSDISNTKDGLPYSPPSVTSWEKPITHSIDSHSPLVTSNTPSTSISNTILSSCSSVIPTDVQKIASMSKSSTFDHSDQHDSSISVNVQTASVLSSQRSTSNDCQIIARTSSGKNANSNEVPDLVWGSDHPLPIIMEHPQAEPGEDESSTSYGSFSASNETTASVYNNADNSSQNKKEAESTEMSFRENSPLQQINLILSKNIDHSATSVKSHIEMAAQDNSKAGPQLMGNFEPKTGICDITSLASSVQVAEIPAVPGPPTVLFNSSQQVWGSDHPSPIVMEHPQAEPGEDESSTSYGSFSGSNKTTASVFNNADNSSQNKKEAESTEMSFRENSPLQQSNLVISKNIDHSATSVKSHIQMAAQHNSMAGPHCTGPESPQFMGNFEPKTGICDITSLASSVQVSEIPAVPCPPTVLFNSSQQVWGSDHPLPIVMEYPQAEPGKDESSTSYRSFSASNETTASVYNNADNSSQNKKEAESTEMSFRENSPLQQINLILSKNIDHSATSVKSHIEMAAQDNFKAGPHCTGPESPQFMGNFEPKTGICDITSLASSVQVSEIPAVPGPPTLLFNSSQQVWGSDHPLPIAMEHPQAEPGEDESSTSYGSFSASNETTASVYNNADNSSQNKKEAESTEMSFRENSPLQQINLILSKNIDHSATSVKSHIEMAAQDNSKAGLQLMGNFEPKTGICDITSLASSVQVAEISAVPGPPTVLFNSSQQVWESDHPQAEPGEDESLTSYGSFSGSNETTASVYNNADNSSQNKKEAESTEMSFRENSALQQKNLVLSKNIDHSATSVKSHIQMAAQHNSMAGPHCTGPVSPQLMDNFEPKTGICDITSLASSVQVAEIPAVPCPPTVLFNSSQQGEENSEIKLEFTFESGLEQLSERKRRSSGNTGHLSKKSKSLSGSMNVSNSSTNVSVQAPISPSADDSILKRHSVKKVWESDHPQAEPGEDESSTSYGSFSGSNETTASVYNNADNSSQNKKEAESTEMSFRENSALQQKNLVISKNIDHSATSVKSHIQMAAQHNSMAGPHCTGPVSPQLMDNFEPKTGICDITSLASSVQVAEIPAVPCPPTVLFNSSQQGEENSEIKLEFTFESGLEQFSERKRRSSGNTGHLSKKSKSLSGSMNVSNSSTNVSVQAPISPSADDSILKIHSVKKVWGSDHPLSIVMEHPQAEPGEDESTTSYGSYSGSNETIASAYNNSDNCSQNKKEAESTEMSFRENSALQQRNLVLSKNIDHSATSVKSHIQMAAQHNSMAGPHCTVPVSPPLMGGFEAMTGIWDITGLASPVQVARIPAVQSPPTVLFNSTQQPHNQNKSGRSRFGRYRLPSRFVKQRKNLVKAVSVNNVADLDISGSCTSKTSNTKDASPSPPPSVNAWDHTFITSSPTTHALHPHFSVVASNTPSTSISNTIVSSRSSVISRDDQVFASTSKSSSFDRSDQHDTSVGVNDQTASALSSQRSSTSNDCQIIASTSSGKNANSNEVPDLDLTSSTCDALPSVGASLNNKFKDLAAETEGKAHSLPTTFRKNHTVKRSSSKVSKRKMKKLKHLETSSPSLADYILNYDKLPKDFNCPKCSFSCLSRQMFKTHSCSEKLKQLADCNVLIKKIPHKRNETETQYICPKCCFSSCNGSKHSCNKRLRDMQNCFVTLEDIKRSKFNVMCPIKVAQICNHLHQALIFKAKQNVVKNAKICTTVDEAMKYIVEPFMQVNATFAPGNFTPDLDLDFTLPNDNQALLIQAAENIFVGNEVLIPSRSRNNKT